ncbi:hypothetical protein [Aminipila sp.]|uniref:hypothetical protein n=1 Tax=Aminipila sp. TaxID=2060095 RepID=UPI00289A0317|nr:hypothetical protein [Aminipila sp.]
MSEFLRDNFGQIISTFTAILGFIPVFSSFRTTRISLENCSFEFHSTKFTQTLLGILVIVTYLISFIFCLISIVKYSQDSLQNFYRIVFTMIYIMSLYFIFRLQLIRIRNHLNKWHKKINIIATFLLAIVFIIGFIKALLNALIESSPFYPIAISFIIFSLIFSLLFITYDLNRKIPSRITLIYQNKKLFLEEIYVAKEALICTDFNRNKIIINKNNVKQIKIKYKEITADFKKNIKIMLLIMITVIYIFFLSIK